MKKTIVFLTVNSLLTSGLFLSGCGAGEDETNLNDYTQSIADMASNVDEPPAPDAVPGEGRDVSGLITLGRTSTNQATPTTYTGQVMPRALLARMEEMAEEHTHGGVALVERASLASVAIPELLLIELA